MYNWQCFCQSNALQWHWTYYKITVLLNIHILLMMSEHFITCSLQ